jgi:hypothetical protein
MRKLLLLAIILINFSVLPTFGADNVIIDRITQKEAEELDLTIPDDVPPGFHSIEIEVYDDGGSVSKKEIPFCKNLDGEIHWDNLCPDVLEAKAIAKLDLVKNPDQLKPYSPLSDTEKTKDLQIAALAALAALGSAKKEEKKPEEDQEQEDIQGVKAGDLKLLRHEPGRGDLSRTWDNRFTEQVDFGFVSLSRRMDKFSPLLVRTIQDGNTLRAIFGSWYLLLLPIALGLGLSASIDVSGNALPPAVGIIIAIMAIAVFDAFSGFIAGSIFFCATLLTGHLGSRSELLTTLGVLVLFFAPALLASSFRPFRRDIKNGDDLWERLTDLALGTLLTYWVITKMVGAMNGLARLELPITNYAHELGLYAAVLLVLRFALEEVTTRLYPVRLEILHVEISERDIHQKIISLEFKIFFFVMLARPFVGYNLQLLLGAIIFAIPAITGLALEDGLPKKKLYLPKGAFKTIVMIFVMAFISKAIEGSFSNPETFLKWNFVVMALPGFALHYLDAITDSPGTEWRNSPAGRLTYRLGGVIIFFLMVLMVRGVDLASWLI